MLLIALGIGAINLSCNEKDIEEKKLIIIPDNTPQEMNNMNDDAYNEYGQRRKNYQCPNGHPLELTNTIQGTSGRYFVCTSCNRTSECAKGRWSCDRCIVDYCLICKPPSEEDFNRLASRSKPKEDDKENFLSDPRNISGIIPVKLVRKIIESDQIELAKNNKIIRGNGKADWVKTHFIFMIDCSVSMKGSRWESVKFGYQECLGKLRYMKEVVITALTFDNKPNPFCVEKTPDQALKDSMVIPFSGTGTNYKRCLEYVMGIISKTVYPNYLICMLFLSDGLGGYPSRIIEEFKDLKERGTNFLFYTIACQTDDDDDMMRMSTELKGEHFAVDSPEGIKNAFSEILTI